MHEHEDTLQIVDESPGSGEHRVLRFMIKRKKLLIVGLGAPLLLGLIVFAFTTSEQIERGVLITITNEDGSLRAVVSSVSEDGPIGVRNNPGIRVLIHEQGKAWGVRRRSLSSPGVSVTLVEQTSMEVRVVDPERPEGARVWERDSRPPMTPIRFDGIDPETQRIIDRDFQKARDPIDDLDQARADELLSLTTQALRDDGLLGLASAIQSRTFQRRSILWTPFVITMVITLIIICAPFWNELRSQEGES